MDVARSSERRPRRLVAVFSLPDSYGLVLLLILVTYALSATITAAWAVSLVLFVQIATIWVTLQASQAHRHLQRVTGAILVVTAIVAINRQTGARRTILDGLPSGLNTAVGGSDRRWRSVMRAMSSAGSWPWSAACCMWSRR